jgi:holo-[acyl-carrier protein] synthase
MMVLGVGVDIESVKPFREKKWPKDARFLSRVFSDGEIRYCRKFADPAPHYAARFCAKEALVKAAGSIVQLFVSDMEVVKKKNGAPGYRARSSRGPVKTFFKTHSIHLSMSHTKDQAVAFAVLEAKNAH